MTPQELQKELGKRSRRWTFTLNNWTEAGMTHLKNLLDHNKTVTYLILGKEQAPSTGTLHLQGYLELTKKLKGSTLKKAMPRGTVLLASKGSTMQNRAYCMKDGDWQEWGTAMQQGKRSDLEGLKLLIDGGATELELAEANFGSFIRYHKGFKHYKNLKFQIPRTWFPEIYIFWGKTGLGKSKKVYDDNDHSDIWTWNGNHQFYQGYDMHPVALFDDFYAEINLGFILKLCDRYPMIVNIKNGQCNWQPRKIYFTSNQDPREWWPDHPEEKRKAFFRRINEKGKIIHFDSLE